MERSRFNQEISIVTGIFGSSTSSGANLVDLDCSCGTIRNSIGESDMQQMLEDNFCLDLGDIIELDLTSLARMF